MKKIEAVIEAFQQDVVIAALRKNGVDEVVVSEVQGPGRSETRTFRGLQWAVDYSPRVKLELVVNDELVMSTASAVSGALCAGRVDGASISVAPVERVVEIEPGDVPAAVPSRVPRYRPAWAFEPARGAS